MRWTVVLLIVGPALAGCSEAASLSDYVPDLPAGYRYSEIARDSSLAANPGPLKGAAGFQSYAASFENDTSLVLVVAIGYLTAADSDGFCGQFGQGVKPGPGSSVAVTQLQDGNVRVLVQVMVKGEFAQQLLDSFVDRIVDRTGAQVVCNPA